MYGVKIDYSMCRFKKTLRLPHRQGQYLVCNAAYSRTDIDMPYMSITWAGMSSEGLMLLRTLRCSLLWHSDLCLSVAF